MRRLLPLIAAFSLLTSLGPVFGPATAVASRGDQIIRDCLRNGRITGRYSQQDFKSALANLPSDVDEYSTCRQVIRSAQLAAARGGVGGATPAGPSASPTSGSDPLAGATAAERASLTRARRGGARPVRIDGSLLHPGLIAARTSSVNRSLPVSLALLIGAIALGALVALGITIRRRVRLRRPV